MSPIGRSIPILFTLLGLLLGIAASAQPTSPDVQARITAARGDFTDQNLSGVSFKNAQLFSVVFVRTNLRGADFTGCNIQGGTFALADLAGADFSGADLGGADFADARNFGKAVLKRVRFWSMQDADLDGADLHALVIPQTRFARANLRGVNFSHCNLMQADFSNADLRDADLSACDLTQADFHDADLRGANLTGSRLTQVNATGADFSTTKGLDPAQANDLETYGSPAKLPEGFPPSPPRGVDPEKTLAELRAQPDAAKTDMRRMKLRGADLHELRIEGSRLPGDLRDANFTDASATAIQVEAGNFAGANLRRAILGNASLIGADLSGARNLGTATLSGSRLDGCNLSGVDAGGVNLSGAHLRGANLASASLQKANLSGARLIGANFRNCDLRNANVARALIADADFTGANLSGVNAEELYGLTQAQLDSMAQKPRELPLRLDPVKAAKIARANSPSPPASPSSRSWHLFRPGWTTDAALRTVVLLRFTCVTAIVVALLLLTLGGSRLDATAREERWQRLMGEYARSGTSRVDNDVQTIDGTGQTIRPSLEVRRAELPLPLRIEIPARVGPAGVRAYVAVNGLVVALLYATLPLWASVAVPAMTGGSWAFVFLVWSSVILSLRGALVSADRSQIVNVTLKARNPLAAARVKVVPTADFAVVSYYFAGGNTSQRYVELAAGWASSAVPLGRYDESEAREIAERVAQALRIATRDEERSTSSD